MEEVNLTGLLPPEPTYRPRDLVFSKNNTNQFVETLKEKCLNTTNHIVNSKHIDYNSEQLHFPDKNGKMLFLTPNDWAMGQLVDKTMGNRTYYKKCKDVPGLAEHNINTWLWENDKNYLIRKTGDTARTFLSDTYLVMDNYYIIRTIASAIGEVNLMRRTEEEPLLSFDRGSLSEGFMYLEILDPLQEYDIGKGQTFQGMVSIKNSDVGGGALHFDAGFFQWACANLHIKKIEGMGKKTHRGDKLDAQVFGEELVQKQAELWVEMLSKGIHNIFKDTELFSQWANEMQELREIKVENPSKIIEDIHVFTEGEVDEITKMLMGDQTIVPEDRGTGFALSSAMTNVAKSWGEDRMHEVGLVSGQLLKVLA